MQGNRPAVFSLLVLTAAGFMIAGVQASIIASSSLKSLYFTQVDGSWVLLSTSSGSGAVVQISFAIAPQRDSGRVFYAVEKGVPPLHTAIIGVQFDSRLGAELIISAPRGNVHKSVKLEMPPSTDWYRFHISYNFTKNSVGNISFSVDGSPSNKSVSVSAEGVSHLLRGCGDFYLGGLPSAYLQDPSLEDAQYWMKLMRNYIIASVDSFQGCMYSPEIQFSSGYIETPGVAEGRQWLANACGEVDNECSPLDPASCGAGVCTEDYDGIWRCDCRETEQTGKDCSNRAAVVPFYGNQGFIIRHSAAASVNFDISLYFKSALSSGMIMYLVDLSNRSKVALSIEEGLLVLEVQLGVNQSEVDYTIAPSWQVETEKWYFVHVTGKRNNVTLQLESHMISAAVALPEGLFVDHSEVTLGDTDMATAPQAFKGCMSNIHFGIQKLADVSVIAEDFCPNTDNLVLPPLDGSGNGSSSGSPPPTELVFPIDTKLGHLVKLGSIYNSVNITFRWQGLGTTGTIVEGHYDHLTAFTLSLFGGYPILQWRTLLDESLDVYVRMVDTNDLCTFTVLKNESHFGLVVEQWGQRSASFDVIRSPGGMEFNTISFGGSGQSLSGVIRDVRVNGYNPTVWTTVHRPDDSSTDVSISLPTPQLSSSPPVPASASTSMVVNAVTATSTPSSSSNDRTSVTVDESSKDNGASSTVLGGIDSSTDLGKPSRTVLSTLAVSASASMRVHQTSSPAPTDSVDVPPSSLVDQRSIAVAMLAATIFVAILVVVIIVLASVFTVHHCWQAHRLACTANQRQGPEAGLGKETPPLKKR